MKFREAILFLVLFCSAFDLFSYDDDYFENELKFGVKGGVNFSTFNGEESVRSIPGKNMIVPATSKLGATFGIIAEYSLSSQFDTQYELIFSSKGLAYETNDYTEIRSIWYIELPVLFKSNFRLENNTDASLFIGPAIAYNIKAQYTVDAFDRIIEEKEIDTYNSFDLSAVIGVSGDMKMFGGKVGLDLRYIYGLINVRENQNSQNGTISATIYYLF